MYQLVIQKRITKRENEVLSEYLEEVSQEPLLSPDEEVELAKRIKEGDEIARDKLIRANLRFVISVAKQFSQTGLPLTDLINEGNIGLIKAAEKFDETKGFKFISYAVWWIRQCIIQAITENCRMIRLPCNKIASANKIKNAYSLYINLPILVNCIALAHKGQGSKLTYMLQESKYFVSKYSNAAVIAIISA
jgi:RNA polymerase primary sigma factor